MSDQPERTPRGSAATDDYTESLDRVGVYLAECADPEDSDDGVTFCHRHPVYVRDLWRLYCAHRTETHRV